MRNMERMEKEHTETTMAMRYLFYYVPKNMPQNY